MNVIGHSPTPIHRTWLWDSLTSRETEVARLVVQGMRNADIAQELHISVHTVESHLKHIYAKLDVHTRVELVRLIRDLTD
ncbi:MAG: helix-turn-helix transcriptional regulator [Chloroflexi bacterium]|nr:helix-turn-helix transcriptional regulator [Chloroflexota bacterium]